ncbi:hypothetical protein [uncultured Streptococcus sp.]|uniref:hypothetical protein n=1 Tax=uncultured Streptococcus sp. TaxID=83427 RepID=UPI0025D2E611|nr:hypothetical protein [uncultured Streptococcus sp.]
MGLSYAPEYVYTEHFIQRANERFGIKEDQLPKWIAKQISSLTLYDSSEEKIPEKRKYISDNGIIFVCDTIERKFITCYEANDLVAEGKKITIHDNNVDLFKQEFEKLSRKYYLKDTKEMLLSVREHLTEFNQVAEKLMTGRVSQQNYELISKLIDEFHVVRAAVRVIETKKNDFKQ